MKTDYSAHDEVYKRQLVEGRPGWGTDEVIRENIATLRRVLDVGHVPSSGRLLELGCGAGDISMWLAEAGYNVYGVDISPTAIAWAQEKAARENLRADFRVGNVLDLADYEDGFFDLVLDGHCFHCIVGEDRPLFLVSALRVLRSGGFFHVSSMCGEVMDEDLRASFDPASRCVVTDGVAFRYIGLAEDIVAEVRRASFRVLRWELVPRRDDIAGDQDHLLLDAVKPWAESHHTVTLITPASWSSRSRASPATAGLSRSKSTRRTPAGS